VDVKFKFPIVIYFYIFGRDYIINKKKCNNSGESLRQSRLKLYELIAIRSSNIYLQMDKEIIGMKQIIEKNQWIMHNHSNSKSLTDLKTSHSVITE
jgi:hypothetical protein